MSEFKLLIDTNVVIGLEDAQLVKAGFAELTRLSAEHGIILYVDGANYDDVSRDTDFERRKITLSKLDKFPKLRGRQLDLTPALIEKFGSIRNANDLSDVRLLTALNSKAVDFLVTEDIRLHRRAERTGYGSVVLTVEEALAWLRQLFQERPVNLPHVIERKAYEIDHDDEIFVSLRDDYDGFDVWFDKCRREHRDCWVLEIENQTAGIVIRKEETHREANTLNIGSKILKVCTFKVRDQFRGERLGELLLKQILWFAQRNDYDVTYLTVFPKHAFLIDLLSNYGFHETVTQHNGELVMEKVISKGRLPSTITDVLKFDRLHYPRFYDGNNVQKFCVPIRPDYHRRLFPEIAFVAELPLFPTSEFGRSLAVPMERTPGNTIRKVYLCHAKIKRLRPGDILLFYMSKDEKYGASQSITTLGIVEQVVDTTSTEELIRLTAKRSVFSEDRLKEMNASPKAPVKAIDFLLIGHIDPPIGLETLISVGAFTRRPPQSIAQLAEPQYLKLKALLKLGFEI